MQRIKKTDRLCPNCENKYLVSVGFQDNFGMQEILEIHCSTVSGGCGYSEDAEGTIRYQGYPIKPKDENEEYIPIN